VVRQYASFGVFLVNLKGVRYDKYNHEPHVCLHVFGYTIFGFFGFLVGAGHRVELVACTTSVSWSSCSDFRSCCLARFNGVLANTLTSCAWFLAVRGALLALRAC